MSTHTNSSAKTAPSIVKTPALFEYLIAHSLKRSPAQAALYEEVKVHPRGEMCASPDESQFLAWLTKLIGAKKVIEVGVFLGYTTLAIAEALPKDGKLVALDVSEEFTSVGTKYWTQAGVKENIDLRIAPAVDSLKAMVDSGEAGTYDLAFIDADKVSYDAYYEYCLTLLKPGGVIAVDNVFRDGEVLDEKTDNEGTIAIHVLNQKIVKDNRVDITMLPLADGLTLARKL